MMTVPLRWRQAPNRSSVSARIRSSAVGTSRGSRQLMRTLLASSVKQSIRTTWYRADAPANAIETPVVFSMVPQARGREFRCASIRWAISISPASAVATNRTSAPPIRSANCCAKRLLPLRAPPRMRMIRAMKLWALNDSLEFDLNALAAWGDQVQPRGHGQLAERSQQSRDRAAMRHGDGQALSRQF